MPKVYNHFSLPWRVGAHPRHRRIFLQFGRVTVLTYEFRVTHRVIKQAVSPNFLSVLSLLKQLDV